MKKWPNFFIVGAPKAGTTTLYHYLNEFPEIYFSKLKEPHYFSRKIVPDNHPGMPLRDEKKYLKLFAGFKNQKIIGESSTTYLADPEAPYLIHKVSPSSRILISLRDPVERTYSQYLMYRKTGYLKPSFHDQLFFEIQNEVNFENPNIGLYHGLYSNNVTRYQDVFGNNRVKIIIFEEFIKNPMQTFNSVLKFLELNIELEYEPKAYNQYQTIKHKFVTHLLKNPTFRKSAQKVPPKIRRIVADKIIFKNQPKPEMSEKDRKILTDYYYEDVHILEKNLGRTLPWSNFQN